MSNPGVKRDFGSFHASNVQELLALSEEDYVPPALPVRPPSFQEEHVQFGGSARDQHFYLDKDCVFLNHGAFGAVLKEALEVSQEWRRYIERQPLRFFDRELLPHLVYVTRRLAKFVGCSAEDLVLVPNVTTAINTIIRAESLQPGEGVYILSTEYGSNKKILGHVYGERDVLIHEERVTFPVTGNQQIVDLVGRTLPANTRLAVFDHIPSNCPFILPVKELVELCHGRGIRVLIDGAHALGQLPLDVTSIGADFYVANAHKWFAAPKGSAFMYVASQHQRKTRPLVVSHGLGSGFNSEFMWSGLRDYTPYLALHTVLDFWESVKPERIRTYIWELAHKAAHMLCRRWGTDVLAPDDMYASMTAVRLPAALYRKLGDAVDYSKAEAVQNLLYHRYNIEVPIKAIQGSLYVRISAHIYNELQEYETLASAILEIMERNLLDQD